MLTGLNHITLSVSDLEKSLQFYRDLLGFTAHVMWDKGAYLSLGELWLCLAAGQTDCSSDYTHIALDVTQQDFAKVVQALRDAGVVEWKNNSSEGDSLYFLDPDKHRLEIHAGSLQSRLESLIKEPYEGLQWLTPRGDRDL